MIDQFCVRKLLKARRLREQLLGAEIFADPAWDLLLEAFAADLAHQPVAVSDLSKASNVPSATALRWIGKLEEDGWLESAGTSMTSGELKMLTAEGSMKLRRLFEILPSTLLI